MAMMGADHEGSEINAQRDFQYGTWSEPSTAPSVAIMIFRIISVPITR